MAEVGSVLEEAIKPFKDHLSDLLANYLTLKAETHEAWIRQRDADLAWKKKQAEFDKLTDDIGKQVKSQMQETVVARYRDVTACIKVGEHLTHITLFDANGLEQS